MMEKPTSLKDELKETMNALYTLLPSHNRISQFLLLAGDKDFDTFQTAFADLIGSAQKKEKFFNLFGFERTDEGRIDTDYNYNDFRDLLKYTIEKVFDLLEDEQWRNRIVATMLEEVPNARLNWVRTRLKSVADVDPLSITILLIFRELAEKEVTQSLDLEFLQDGLQQELELEKSRLQESIATLQRYDLMEKDDDEVSITSNLWKYRGVIDEIETKEREK